MRLAKDGKSRSVIGKISSALACARRWKLGFLRRNWIGTAIILAATIAFFTPMVIRLDSYSPGGDAMFNAWELSRNQHCIMRQNCPNYLDANIYFPNKDTMLYSEMQFSPALITLPLRLISDNPLFIYNVWTITCVFLGGWFMYLLAKRLSRGNEYVSVLAGLIFAFAPFKMAATFHMQNISIFFLPLAVLLAIRYFDTNRRRYLVGLLVALILQFYASWYQMVFVLAIFVFILLGLFIFKLVERRQVYMVAATLGLATLTIAPVGLEYVRFSHESGASFSITEQILYESSLVDYVMPHDGTVLGKVFYRLMPEGAHRNAWNLDSYSYHGIVLYVMALVMVAVVAIHLWRKKISQQDKGLYVWLGVLAVMGFAGFILSLGPVLKIAGAHTYYGGLADGSGVSIPMPYLLIDKFLPQLQFIRAVGRWSTLTLFALCCMLAFLPRFMPKINWANKRRKLIYALIGVAALVELAPIHTVQMSPYSYSYNMKIPGVYKYIKDHKDVDNIVIIHGDSGYPDEKIPVARAEWVLWAGYHNKNIFNGYSGYEPPNYMADYIDFKDLDPHDLIKMREFGLKYVVIDKQLSATRPELIQRARAFFPQKLYEDRRYVLFKIPD